MKARSFLFWIARISSLLSIAFLLIMLFGHLFGEEGMGEFSKGDALQFTFFPVMVLVGLFVGWFRPGLGGLIGTLGIVAFHLIRNDLYFIPWIDGLSFPCLLYLIYWLLKRADRSS